MSYSVADSAARKVEAAGNVEFLRIDKSEASGTDYLDHKHVFTAARTDGHDAWTDLYSSAEFYKWLLRQERGEIAVSEVELR